MPARKFEYGQVVWDHRAGIIEEVRKFIDFRHTMRITTFEWGWVIETTHIDEDDTVTKETLISYTGYTATITYRERYGPNHDEMKTYPRDDLLPIPSIVRLRP